MSSEVNDDDIINKSLDNNNSDNLNNNENPAFDALERDFLDVLQEIGGDENMERFRVEYEKLHQALKRSHHNEKRLIKKCRELNQELYVNAQKVQQALRMSRSDQNNINLLKKEIDNAWKIVDSAQEKEKRARETIQNLKNEVERLTKVVDQGTGLTSDHENALNSLVTERDSLNIEVKDLKNTLSKLRDEHSILQEECNRYEQKTYDQDREIHQLQAQISAKSVASAKDEKKFERLQAELTGLKDLNEQRKSVINKKNDDIDSLKNECNNLMLQKKEMDYALDKYRDIAEELRLKNEELEKVVQYHVNQENSLLMQHEATLQDLRKRKEEIRKKNSEVTYLNRKLEKIEHEKDLLQNNKTEAEGQRDYLRKEMSIVQKELESQMRHADADEKIIKDLQTQVMRLVNSLAATKEKNRQQLNLVKQAEESVKRLEDDILNHKSIEEKLRQRNYELEKDREKAASIASQLKVQLQDVGEEGRMKALETQEMNRNIDDINKKLKLQQTLYEQVRADRNLFSKQHIQSQDQIAEMKRKFKIMGHQIEQLKDEISTKDQALVNEHFAFKRLKDEVKVLKRKLSKRDEVIQAADQVLASQDSEIKSIRSLLIDAEQAQKQQKKVYDNVVQERDILGTQLIRRNDELALLYEKIRIQQSTLNKGELQYQERLNEINLLRLSLSDARRELAIQQNQINSMDALKSEIQHLQQELLQERTKVKALTEELENPMNVHRWRQLEGNDPQRYELIQKVQVLQKRLIAKSEETAEKEALLKEKERLYQQLKDILGRQPGPEVAEQLSVYQKQVQEKNRQLKSMAAELNMLQAQISELQFDLDRAKRELQESKYRHYETKKK